MSKERLEEIGILINKYRRTGFNKDAALKYSHDLIRDHGIWLHQQAERVQALAKLREEDSTYYNEVLTETREQNKRYRRAIEKAYEELKWITPNSSYKAYRAFEVLAKELEDES